jgi:hypothetical protein
MAKHAGVCKIGSTANVNTRIESLQTKYPRLTLVHAWQCSFPPAECESKLHAALNRFDVHDRFEWFRLPEDVVAALCSIRYLGMDSKNWAVVNASVAKHGGPLYNPPIPITLNGEARQAIARLAKRLKTSVDIYARDVVYRSLEQAGVGV